MKLADRVANISESVTLGLTAKAKKLAKEGIDLVSFTAGEPDFDTPKNIKNAAIESIEGGFTKYTPSSGIPELREAICGKLLKDNQLQYKPEQIIVSCGAKHSLYNLIQALCDKGDEVIIPSPYWVSYPEMVSLAEGESVFVKTKEENDFKATLNDLKKATTKKTKLFILNSPSNPTGCVYALDELRAIAAWAVDNNVFVISDEIYEKLIYDSEKHISIASLNEDIKTLTAVVNGLSKTYSMTGWRIGYLAACSEVAQAVNAMQSHSTSNPTSISQKAALEAILGDQSFIEVMKKEYLARRDYMAERLNKIKGFSCRKPRGAFYIFCNISGLGIKSDDLANRLIDEARVVVVPGAGFGDDHFIRLSFATSIANIKKGIDRLEQWAKR